MKRHHITRVLLAAAPVLLPGCAAGPDYVRPQAYAPAAYKELADWKPAQPRDHLPRGRWWSVFSDPLLDGLQEQVSVSNQSLAQARAAFRQSLALMRAARSAYFPTTGASVASTRSRASATTGSGGSSSGKGIVDRHTAALDVFWEADVWGRIGRSVEAGVARAQASAADVEAARLSLQTLLALNYFQLRSLDAQKALLENALGEYDKANRFAENQYRAGVASRADVVQALTQYKTTEAQMLDVGVQRAQLEHAIAVLVGKAPAQFAIERAPLAAVPPVLPPGLPSALLERRPDIAAAERRVTAANAQIGVATAAYFPLLSLGAAGGVESASASRWFTAPSRFWSIGPAIALTLFDGGLRRAVTDQTVAAYDATVAGYRQAVLAAFQEVEDSLAALRILEREAAVQDEAVRSARDAVTLTLNQYKAGTVNYLNVVTVQTTALSNERTAVDIQARRLAAAVQLVKALGGGWEASALASYGEMSALAADPAGLR